MEERKSIKVDTSNENFLVTGEEDCLKEKISLMFIDQRAMKLHPDYLTAEEILQLYEILKKLEGLKLQERLDKYERRILLDKVNQLEVAQMQQLSKNIG